MSPRAKYETTIRLTQRGVEKMKKVALFSQMVSLPTLFKLKKGDNKVFLSGESIKTLKSLDLYHIKVQDKMLFNYL